METPTGIRRFKIGDSDTPFLSSLSFEENNINVETLDLKNMYVGDWCSFKLPNDTYVICNNDVYEFIDKSNQAVEIKNNNVFTASSEEEANNIRSSIERALKDGINSDRALCSYKTIDIKSDSIDDIIFARNGNAETYFDKEKGAKIADIYSLGGLRQRISNIDDSSYIYEIDWSGDTLVSLLIGVSESVCGILIKEDNGDPFEESEEELEDGYQVQEW